MASQLLGIKTRFTNDVGQPLIGGQVYTYFAGTSTNQDSYSDAALTVPNTNPVILDDTGSADIFLKGSYRIRVFDASGRFIEEQDNVTQAASQGDAEGLRQQIIDVGDKVALVEFDKGIKTTLKESIPTAVERTQDQKNADSINIRDFFNPLTTTDHTQAFKNALDAVADMSSATVNLNSGDTYILSDKLITNQSNLTIAGNGAKIIWDGEVGGTLYDGIFEFTGELTNISTTVAVSAAIDSSFIKVTNAALFVTGDYVLAQSSTPAIKPHRFIGQLFRVANVDVSTNTLLLDTAIGVDFDISTYSISITKVNTVNNSHIVDIDFEAINQTSREVGISAVQMQYTSACTARINATGFWFKGVSFRFSNGAMSSFRVSKPAATGGGEGYGLQFEYCTNSMASNSSGVGLRHLVDATASFGITFNDMNESGSISAGYNLHSMCEHNIKFINCHSSGGKQYGFGIGSYGAGVIGQWAGRVSLVDCTSKDSLSIAVKATTANGDYRFTNCDFKTLDGSASAYSLVVSNADVSINNCNLDSGLYVLNAPETKNDGFVKVQGGRIGRNPSTKAIQMSENTRLDINACSLNNYWSLLGKCELNIGGKSIITTNGDHFVPSTKFTHNISISDSTINLRGVTNSLYIMYGDEINLNNVKFDSTNNIGMRVYSNKTVITNCRGALRLSNDAANIVELKNNSLDLDATFTSAITLNNTKAAIDIDSNRIKFRSTNTVSINTTNTVASLKYSNNTVDGNVAIPAVPTKGIFMGNITAGTSTFPAASSTVLVKDNI